MLEIDISCLFNHKFILPDFVVYQMPLIIVVFHCYGQCSKNRPICRLISQLIMNRWVSNKITTYRSDLSSWPIYQSDSRYFDQNVPNFATYGDLVDDSSARETIFWTIGLVLPLFTFNSLVLLLPI
jgi:hypothetical protein